MKFRSIITVAAIAAVAIPCGAQEQLHGSVTVEGEYQPEIIHQQRISNLPVPMNPAIGSQSLPLAEEGVTADFTPDFASLPAMAPLDRRTTDDSRGYLRLGAGSFLNVTGSAGYRFLDTERTRAGLWLQHTSTSLFHPFEDYDATKRRLFDETAGLYVSHDFNGAGLLDASLTYHLGYFNYYGMLPPADAPTQTLNDILLRASWRSAQAYGRPDWNVAASWRSFGYRRAYLPGLEPMKGLKENHIALNGGISTAWDSGSRIGLDARFDALIYSGPQRDAVVTADQIQTRPDNYSSIDLNPYYSFSRENLLARIGARVDLSFNAGERDNRFSAFHIAPDVRLDWRYGPVGLFIHALGGIELQTLAAGADLDYYRMPLLESTRPVYSPLDLQAGIEAGPFSGFSAGVSVAYKISNNRNAGGWYMQYLNYGPQLFADGREPMHTPVAAAANAIDIKGFSIRAHIDWDIIKAVSLRADGSYQNQNADKGYFNGFDRPRWVLDLKARIRPIDALCISVGYAYRGVRNFYYLSQLDATPAGILPDPEIMSLRVPDMTDLHASVTYRLIKPLTIWIEARNLLGTKTVINPMLPAEGLALQGGLSLKF